MSDTPRIVLPASEVVWSYEGDTTTHYNEELMLAQLLIDGKIHLGEGLFLPASSDATDTVCAVVNCNDLFAWGCEDYEPVTLREIPALYFAHMADTRWGTDVWCLFKRGELPRASVLREMLAEGCVFTHAGGQESLRPNTGDEEAKALVWFAGK